MRRGTLLGMEKLSRVAHLRAASILPITKYLRAGMLVQFRDELRALASSEIKVDRNGRCYYKLRPLTPAELLWDKLDPKDPDLDTCGQPATSRIYLSDIVFCD